MQDCQSEKKTDIRFEMLEYNREDSNDSSVPKEEFKEENVGDSSQESEESFKQTRSQQKKRKVRIIESDDEDSNSLPLHVGVDASKKKNDDDDDDAMPASSCCSQWVQCDNPECQKWRRVDFADDLNEFINTKWICRMNEDKRKNTCEASQETVPSDTENECYTSYKPGTLLWGKVNGYPWWPCIVENDPDYNTFYWNYRTRSATETRTTIHLTFLGKDVSRAWLNMNLLRTFTGDEHLTDMGTMKFRKINFKNAVKEAFIDAKKCLNLSFQERLKAYGFQTRYNDDEDRRKQDMQNAEAKMEMSNSSNNDKKQLEEGISYEDFMYKDCGLEETDSDELSISFELDSQQDSSDTDNQVKRQKISNKENLLSKAKNKAWRKLSKSSSKHKKNERKQQKPKKLTRDEVLSIPKLVKPNILPIDYELVAEMAEKLVNEEKEKAKKEAYGSVVTSSSRADREATGGAVALNEEKIISDTSKECFENVILKKGSKKKSVDATVAGRQLKEVAYVGNEDQSNEKMIISTNSEPSDLKGDCVKQESQIIENKSKNKENRMDVLYKDLSAEQEVEDHISVRMQATLEKEKSNLESDKEKVIAKPKQRKRKNNPDEHRGNVKEKPKGKLNERNKSKQNEAKPKKVKHTFSNSNNSMTSETKSRDGINEEKELLNGLKSKANSALIKGEIDEQCLLEDSHKMTAKPGNSIGNVEALSHPLNANRVSEKLSISTCSSLKANKEIIQKSGKQFKQDGSSRKLKKTKFAVPKRKRIESNDDLPSVSFDDHKTATPDDEDTTTEVKVVSSQVPLEEKSEDIRKISTSGKDGTLKELKEMNETKVVSQSKNNATPNLNSKKAKQPANDNTTEPSHNETDPSSPHIKVVKGKIVPKKKSRLLKIKDQYEDRNIVSPVRASAPLKCKESSAFVMSLESPKSKSTLKKKILLGKKTRENNSQELKSLLNEMKTKTDGEGLLSSSLSDGKDEQIHEMDHGFCLSPMAGNVASDNTSGLNNIEEGSCISYLSSSTLNPKFKSPNEFKAVSSRCNDPIMPVVRHIVEAMDDSPEF